VVSDGFQVVVVADDHLDAGPEVAVGPRLQQCFEAVGLLRDEDRDGLGLAVAGEPHLDVEAEVRAQVVERVAQLGLGTGHRRRVDVHRHPEDAVPDGLVEVLDVDVALEQERRHAGDESGLVLTDDRDLRVLPRHADHHRTGDCCIASPRTWAAKNAALSAKADGATTEAEAAGRRQRESTNVHTRADSQAFSPTDAHPRVMTAYTATVTVRLERGVLDPEAETTQRALERLGFELEDLRSADRFEVDLEAADADDAAERAAEMAERLLANPTIHDYEVDVEER
jgi:phosphoribosylformylglycinamidine synthase